MNFVTVLVTVVTWMCVHGHGRHSGYGNQGTFVFPRKGFQAGFSHGQDGIVTPYRNDERQLYVNNLAYRVGSGTGTAKYDGVAGTGFAFKKQQDKGYHQQHHGSGSYGKKKSYSPQHVVYGYEEEKTYGHEGRYEKHVKSQPYKPRNSYDHDPGYGQEKGYGQQNSYGYDQGYGQEKHYGQQSSYGHDQSYGQEKKSYGHDQSYGQEKKSYGLENSYGHEKKYAEEKGYEKHQQSYGQEKKYHKDSYGHSGGYGQPRSYGQPKDDGRHNSYGHKKHGYGEQQSYSNSIHSQNQLYGYGSQEHIKPDGYQVTYNKY